MTQWTYETGGWQFPGWSPSPDFVLAQVYQHAVAGPVTLVADDGRRIDVTRATYLDDTWRLQLKEGR